MAETATPTRTDEVRADGAIPPTPEESATIDDLRKRMEHPRVDQRSIDDALAEVEGILVAGRMADEDEAKNNRAKAMQAINALLGNAPDGYVFHLRDKLDGAEECDPIENAERNAAIEELRTRLRYSNFGEAAVKNITRGLGFLVTGEHPLNTPEPNEDETDDTTEEDAPPAATTKDMRREVLIGLVDDLGSASDDYVFALYQVVRKRLAPFLTSASLIDRQTIEEGDAERDEKGAADDDAPKPESEDEKTDAEDTIRRIWDKETDAVLGAWEGLQRLNITVCAADDEWDQVGEPLFDANMIVSIPESVEIAKALAQALAPHAMRIDRSDESDAA